MIVNELQYRVTKEQREGFKRRLAWLHKPDNETKKTKPDLWQLHVDAVQSGIDEFTAQMRAYEELINRKPGQTMVFEVDSVKEIARALTKARIAAGISQKELAEELGVEEEELKLYEDRQYEHAPFIKLVEASRLLGLKFQQSAMVEVGDVELEDWKIRFMSDFMGDDVTRDGMRDAIATSNTSNTSNAAIPAM